MPRSKTRVSDTNGSPVAEHVDDDLPKKVNSSKPAHLTEGDIRMIAMLLCGGPKKMVAHHISSMNDFGNHGLNQILTEFFTLKRDEIPNERAKLEGRDQTQDDRDIEYFGYYGKFHNVRLKQASRPNPETGKLENVSPDVSRHQGLTFSAPLSTDFTFTTYARKKDGSTLEQKVELKDLFIGEIPIMVRSNADNTGRMTRPALVMSHDDPNDHGGYFIVDGIEWVVELSENILFNYVHYYFNKGRARVYAEIISKAGDTFENSSRLMLKLTKTGTLHFELNASTKFRAFRIPFLVLFRSLGVTSDRDLYELVLGDLDRTDAEAAHIRRGLDMAVSLLGGKEDKEYKALLQNDVRDPQEVLAQMLLIAAEQELSYIQKEEGKPLESRLDSEEGRRLIVADSVPEWDRNLLPHLGTTAEARSAKARFIAGMLARVFLVDGGFYPTTDRDSLRTKRIHPAADSLAKTFKTVVNAVVIRSIRRQLREAYKNVTFKAIRFDKVIQEAIRSRTLVTKLAEAIKSGDEELILDGGTSVKNRVPSQQMKRKNMLNSIVATRMVSANAANVGKGNDRAEELRRVHPSMAGFFDATQTPDTGKGVGMKKQLALTCQISPSGAGALLKDHIRRLTSEGNQNKNGDKPFTLYDYVRTPPVKARQMSTLFVNGDPLGFVESGSDVVQYFKQMRRSAKEWRTITVDWNSSSSDIYLWNDRGRPIRPLLRVENGELVLTQAQLERIRTSTDADALLEDLFASGALEYISPEESEGSLIAPSWNTLYATTQRERAGEIPPHRYTHCEIQPAVVGLASMISPFINHSECSRNSILTNQAKSAMGIFSTAFPYRTDKDTPLMPVVDMPLCPTLTNRIVPPNGRNVIVAIMIFDGLNQEDSAVSNRGSSGRCLMDSYRFDFYTARQEAGEVVAVPDLREANIRPNANYGKLRRDPPNAGLPQLGVEFHKNDILVGRVATVQGKDGPEKVDKSLVYRRGNESALVLGVDSYQDQRGDYSATATVVKVKVVHERPLRERDKISARSGNKAVLGKQLNRADLPYTRSGMVPDIIMTPMGIPSRQICNQLIEMELASYAAKHGVLIDASPFMQAHLSTVLERTLEDASKDLAKGKNPDNTNEESELARIGFRRVAMEPVYDPVTGRRIPSKIYMGPTFIQRLAHDIVDKSYGVTSGAIDPLTRQPKGGKARDGSFRFGEMEKDAVVAHGAQAILDNKFFRDSDRHILHICRTCQRRAAVNPRRDVYLCAQCGDAADIVPVASSYSAHQFYNYVDAMGIDTHFIVE